jgi:two-component system response regulator NreC
VEESAQRLGPAFGRVDGLAHLASDVLRLRALEQRSGQMSISVLLADDHGVVREGLRRYLEDADDIQVTGEAADGLEAIEKAQTLHPQVILMDIAMPILGGLEATREIKRTTPHVAVVFLTMHESEEYFLEALRSGANGYVPKSAPAAEVVEAVRCAARGQVYLHPSVTRFLLQGYLGRNVADDTQDSYQALTPREREVLSMVVNGLTTHDIASRLFLSPNTVHRHRNNLMQKLELHDRLDLLRYCLRRGLIDLES